MQGDPESLVKFKAGKLNLNGTTLTPDTKAGMIELRQSAEDSLIHFIWKDVASGETTDDLIIFPQEAIMRRLAQCQDGVAYELKFNSSNKKLFFWSQERRKKEADLSNPEHTKKEDEFVKKLNSLIDNPPAAGQQGFPPGMSQDRLLAMLTGNSAPFTPNSAGNSMGEGGDAAGNNPVQLGDLQNVLRNMGVDNLSTQEPTPDAAPAVTPTPAPAAATTPAPQGDAMDTGEQASADTTETNETTPMDTDAKDEEKKEEGK